MLERGFLVQQVLDAVELLLPADVEVGVCDNNLIAMAGTGKYRTKIGTVRPHNIYHDVIDTQAIIVIEKIGCDVRCIKCTNRNQCEYKTLICSPICKYNSNEVVGLIALLSRETYVDTLLYAGVIEKLARVMQNIIVGSSYEAASLSTILDVINDSIIMVDNKGDIVKKSINAFSGIIGTSKVITDMKEQAIEIAAMNANVLICGETGTGKELMVKAIHQASHRKNKSFVVVNCGAIPDSLMESELFGYVGGAFTGANKEGKAGKFELADEGTLFLDEIGELSLPLQAKLLRVLEDSCIDRLGGRRPVDIDVRVITATNRDLGEMVQQGKFRQDLYYRLNAFMLELPPLRERKADIPILVEYYTNYFNLKCKKNIAIDTSLMEAFLEYSWPGNIRELRNVLEFSIALEKRDILTCASIPTWMQKQFNKRNREPIHAMKQGSNLEMEIIQESINLYGKSTEGKKQVAKTMGISLATLYRKMEKLGIQ